jgi:hypothetical protein
LFDGRSELPLLIKQVLLYLSFFPLGLIIA